MADLPVFVTNISNINLLFVAFNDTEFSRYDGFTYDITTWGLHPFFKYRLLLSSFVRHYYSLPGPVCIEN